MESTIPEPLSRPNGSAVPRRWLAGLVALVVLAGGLGLSSAGADPKDSPDAPVSLVGVYVDAHDNGATRMSINCDGETLDGPDGDGTLFIANVTPGKLRCTITITAN